MGSRVRLSADSLESYWAEKLQKDFGIGSELMHGVYDGYLLLRQAYQCLSMMPASLVKACGVVKLIFRADLGESKAFSPNHGYFQPSDNTVTLNALMFYNPDQPDDFFDHRGYFISRPVQTILHEFGHALDHHKTELSLQDAWLKLSGWSKDREPGLKRLIIQEPGAPKVIGEWWYSPEAEFTRFYAKRNPWDDWADSFSFYVGGLKEKVPANKREYLDKLLSPYYK